jgi:hypothetical protein
LTAPATLTPSQEQAAARVDALDLEPVVFGLMHPYPGLTVMGTAEADQVIAAYRGWLKLCAWYPDKPLVPTLTVGDAWHTHLADTAKYASDTAEAFGAFAHCYPYGHDSKSAWHQACQQTRALFRRHFGADMPGTAPCGDEQFHPEAECCTGWSGCILILAPSPLAYPGASAVPLLGRGRPVPPSARPPARQTPDRDGAPVRAPQPGRPCRRPTAPSRRCTRLAPFARPDRERPARCLGQT